MSKPLLEDEISVGLILSRNDPGSTTAYINTQLATVGRVRLPQGTISVTATIVVPTGAILEGCGPTTILAAAAGLAAGSPIISVAGATDVLIQNMKIVRTASLGGDCIDAYGSRITIRDVITVDGLYGILINDRTSIDAGTSRQILLDRCFVSMVTAPTALTSVMGIQWNTCASAYMRDCDVTNYWLDGVKLRRSVLNFEWLGGSSYLNGRSTTDAGDGIDCFAGANNSIYISSVALYDNGIANAGLGGVGGNGIVIKTVNQAIVTNPTWGQVRGCRIENCFLNNNYGAGFTIEGVVNSQLTVDEANRPAASQIHIVNCVSTNNLVGGGYNGFQGTISQCTFRNSGHEGLLIGPQARDVLVDQCLFWGNGSTSTGVYNQMRCQADGAAAPQRIRMSNCRFNGKSATDTDYIIDDTTYVGLTTISKNPIYVDNNSDEIYVQDCVALYHTADASNFNWPVQTNMTTGILWVRHHGSHGNPTNRIYGGLGSQYWSSATGSNDTTLWVKMRGTPADVTGWVATVQYQDFGIYGTGSDGDVVLGAGTTTITRDMFYNTLSVPSGATLETNGYRVFVRGNTSVTAGTLGFAGALTVAAGGTIRCNGQDAITTTGGIVKAAGSIKGRVVGGSGGVAAGSVGGSTNTPITYGGTAGAGGAGGGGAGGAAGSAPPIANSNGSFSSITELAHGCTANNVFTDGGPGGGGGGGDGALAGGGGGGGGGVLIICARTISNLGAIECKGGAGAAGPTNNTGGGGGGGGGVVFIIAFTAPGASGNGNACDVSGGAAGAAGGGTGVIGTVGTAGLIIWVRPA